MHREKGILKSVREKDQSMYIERPIRITADVFHRDYESQKGLDGCSTSYERTELLPETTASKTVSENGRIEESFV